MICWSALTTVRRIDERFRTIHISGIGSAAVMKEVSIGWYVQFEGSQEALFYGQEKPGFEVGDGFKISFERTSK